MKNRLLQLAGGLALLAVLGKFYAVPAIAQAVRAAAVKNIDERGRTPYGIFQSCSASPACVVSLPLVPAGKRLVLEYINVGVFMGTKGGTVEVIQLAVPDGPNTRAIPFAGTQVDSLGNVFAVHEPVRAYYDAGTYPDVYVQVTPKAAGGTNMQANVYLAGYLVDLTQ